MEEHVDGQIYGIAESGIDACGERARASPLKLREAAYLQKTVDSQKHGHAERCLQNKAPKAFGRYDRRHYDDKEEHVDERDPAIHALVVAPKALERICAKHVCKPHDSHKYGE